MSQPRTFTSVADVRLAVAQSLGFGVRNPSPYESEQSDPESPPADPIEAAAANPAAAEEPEAADALSAAEEALRSIRDVVERGEQSSAAE
jgi:hypothetical protein